MAGENVESAASHTFTCADCKKVLVGEPGQGKCNGCRAKRRGQRRRRYEARKVFGLCPICGRKPERERFKLCAGCRKKNLARKEKRGNVMFQWKSLDSMTDDAMEVHVRELARWLAEHPLSSGARVVVARLRAVFGEMDGQPVEHGDHYGEGCETIPGLTEVKP